MERTSEKPPLWTKDFVRAIVSNLFLWFSLQMLIPTLPVFVGQRGGDEFSAGMVTGIFTIAALITRPFIGKALDTMDRRKILFLGYALCILAMAGNYRELAVSLILLLRFIHGIGWGIATTTVNTILSDILPAARRGEGMGYFGLSNNLAMAIGPLAGIWIMDRMGFGVLSLIASAIGGLALGLSRPIRYPQPIRVKKTGNPSVWHGMFEPKALFPAFLMSLLCFTYGGIIGFITLFGKEAGVSNIGWFFLSNALMIMLVRPFAGILFDRRGPAWVLLPGACFAGAGLFLLSYASTAYLLILSAMFYGIGFGAIQPSLQAWTINRVEPHRRGVANGTYFTAFDTGIGVGAMVLGGVAKIGGYETMYRISALAMLLFLTVYVFYLGVLRKARQY